MLRLGFFTSPAVKVMLFQASAENSEPTCTTARITSRFTSTMGPPTPTCTGMQRTPAGILPELAPARAEVRRHAAALRPTVKASRISAASDSALAVVKTFWISAPSFTPKMFTMARKTTTADAGQVGRVDADLHIAQHHRPNRERGHMGDVPEPMGRRDGREKDAEKLAEGHRDGGDGSRLNDQKERPAVEKSPQRPQRLAQVDVLAAGLGHHGRQLAVAERGDHGQDGRHHPRAQKQRRGVGAAGNVRVDDEDAGADHRSDHQRGRAEKAKALHQPGSVGAGSVSCSGV